MKYKLIVGIVLLSLVAAPVAAQVDQELNADLEIRQPHYVESDVQVQDADGDTLYVVKGQQQRIRPTNFDPGNVVEFGVETEGGTMNYDSDFGTFTFSPSAQGTYEVYWIVGESDGNQTIQTRYIALIRVEGGLNLQHIPQSQLDQREEYAELGEYVNETIIDIRGETLPLAANDGTDKEIFDAMTIRYISTGNPIGTLTGNYTEILALMVLTLGGLIFFGQIIVILGYITRTLRSKLNLYETTEQYEGEIAERQARLDQEERERIAQNVDYNDIFKNDHVAKAWRETFGETPHDGYTNLVSTQILPETWVKERLLAMSKHGWSIDLDKMELKRPEQRTKSSIEDNIDEVVEEIDWNDPDLRDFDLANAEYELDDFDEEPSTLSLSNLIEELDVQMQHFENEKVAGQYLREYIQYFEEHPYTDPDGRVVPSREILNQWLKLTQMLRDRFGHPETRYVSQAIERALLDWDPSEQADTFAREVEDGRYS